MRRLGRRVAMLEARKRLASPQRIIVQYCDQGGEPPEPPDDCDENTVRVIVEYVNMPVDTQLERGGRFAQGSLNA